MNNQCYQNWTFDPISYFSHQVNMETMLKKIVEYDYERVRFADIRIANCTFFNVPPLKVSGYIVNSIGKVS